MDDLTLSWKPEVRSGGAWQANGLRFATEGEATAWLERLKSRWGLDPQNVRVSPSVDPVNEKFVNGRSVPVATIYA